MMQRTFAMLAVSLAFLLGVPAAQAATLVYTA